MPNKLTDESGTPRSVAEARLADAAPALPVTASRVLGWLSVAAGVSVLVGWMFDLPTLKSVLPGIVAMKANTALGFVLAGLSLVIVTRGPGSLLASRALASATALIGLLTLAQYAFHLDLGIDQMLFQEPPGAVGTFSPGRMAATTALAFLLFGLARWLATSRRTMASAQLVALPVALLGFLSIAGYVCGATALVGIGSYTQMAVHTAALFMVLALGLLLRDPAEGFMQAVRGDNPSGWLLRRMLPVLLVVPLVIGWFGVRGMKDGQWTPRFAVALVVALLVVVLMSITFWAARRLSRAEEALRENENRLQLAVRGGNLGTWDWDIPSGRVAYNDRWAEMLGYSLGEIEQNVSGWERLLHPDDRLRNQPVLEASLRGDTASWSWEQRLLHKDGHWVWVLGSGAVVSRNPDGTALRAAGTHLDITERKQAEEARAKLEAQLLQSRKMESVGRLAGGVAHDFNNMLGVILGHAALALEEVDPASPLHADLKEVERAARRSADLTRQLLAFARKQTIKPVALDLNPTVSGMLKMLRRLLGEDINLTWRPGAGLWLTKVDPSQFEQVLVNLCVNARDAITGVGQLIIETGNVTIDEAYCGTHPDAAPGEFIKLVVSDDGRGMDRETLSHLFEPFFTTKVMGKGTGLGLATIYGIVKQSAGFINVYSEPGSGSTFTVYLPRHLGQALPEAAAATPAVGGHETVLLVEDEPGLLKVTGRMLERLGYTVLAAGTPGEALRLAGEHSGQIHLLLTDVVMPEMNGPDLAGRLGVLRPQLKRMFMSGYTANVVAHHGVLGDDVHFIQKPFNATDLTAAVRAALDG